MTERDQMLDYRVYVVGRDGHFVNVIVLSCDDDSAAIATTKLLINGHDLELWQRGRKIARFDSKPDRGMLGPS